MKTTKKSKAKKTFFLFRHPFLIAGVTFPVSIGFNHAYAYFVGQSDAVLGIVILLCLVSLVNVLWFVIQHGNRSSDRRVPNEDNHFAPGYLNPRAINSSKVDPGNQTMDPFDPFDNN